MEFNVQPYNDDFQQNAKDNNYLKILFKPGYSVQARELTQIQSILQNQIKSFGDHIFQDGSPVIGGNLALDNTVTYILLDETYNNEDIEPEEFVGKVILRDSDSLVQAKVLASYFPSGGFPTLMIKYISGVDFSPGDVLRIAGTTTRAKIAIYDERRDEAIRNPIGKGTIASINDGIFYVDGYFVTVLPQTTVVAAYSQKANVKIGLEVNDEVIDYTIDSTLLDPAQDSFNYQAPGADRYQFQLNLSTRPLETSVDESKFFELMRVESGTITKQVKYPIYSEIEKTLARRTFDESGDYTVIPFRASVNASQNANNYIINIEPGKAYVKGFEFETIGTIKMEVEKPRETGVDTRSLVDIDFDTSYGNYLKFKDVKGNSTVEFIDTADLSSVDLHCTHVANVNVGIGFNSNTFVYQNTKIGTAKVRALRRDYPDLLDANVDYGGVFDFYFTDINIQPRIFKITAANTANITLPVHAAFGDGAYTNTTITVLPIQLTTVSADINKANTRAGSVRVNANSTATFTGNVSVGDIIRVGDEVRQVVTVSANYLLVNSAFTKTIEGTGASNPLEVLKQTAYTSNVTGQTRKIVSYSGSSRVANLDRAFDENAVPAVGTVIQLNFGVQDLKCLIKPNTSATLANAHANISVQSTLLDGSTEMFEPSDKKLIFRLPQNTVKKGLRNVEYTHQKYIQATGGPTFTLPLATYEERPWSITNSNIEDNLIVVVRQSSNATFTVGSIPKLNTSSVTEGVGSIIVTLPSDVTAIDAYMIVRQTGSTPGTGAETRKREKTFRSNTSLTTSPWNYPANTAVTADYTVNVPNVGNVAKINVANGLIYITNANVTNIFPGDSISLYVPDVVNVRAVLKGASGAEATNGAFEDITEHFVVDLGQTEEMYDHAKLILKQGYPSPNAQLIVHVDFYEHTQTGTFFSVDSYDNTIYENGQIPVYFSEKEGTYFLRDCLDFRPTRRIGRSDGLLDTGIPPDPNASTGISFDYYLPRIDKLVLSKNKEFRILKGISSPTPIPPEDSDDAMTLYTIYLAPFVATIEDIRLKYNENRRYTMKDISRIDKRVQSLEYYTSLNNIEGMALADSSKYEDGTDKAKFGIIGEGFKNFNIADYKDPDFNCSMEEGEMGPYVGHVPFNMRELSMSGLRKNDRTVTLDFTEEVMVAQPVTSNKLVSVQPFLFAQFIGDVKLSPEMDYWVSEELRPDVLRAPEIDSRIREIYNSERAAEKVIEPPVQVTVPTPSSNAANLIVTVPGSDPPSNPVTDLIVNIPPVFPPLVPSIPFTPPKLKKKKRSIFDNIKLLFPVVNAPAPAPVPPTPPTTLPVYTAPVTATRTLSSGGGGCVVLESYIPWVDGQVFNDHDIRQAFQLQRSHRIWLANEKDLEVWLGAVRDVCVELQPCVRVTTTGGVSLVCSTTAPLPTLRGVVKAPDVKGEKVAVLKDNMTYWETVESVESVGDKFVMVIDAHNNSFWAGEKEGAYILHHNMAFSSMNVEKV